MPVEPWKVIIIPEGSCKILDEGGGLVAKYAGLIALADAHARSLRTIRRLRDTFSAILRHPHNVVIEDQDEAWIRDLDSTEPPPF